MEQIEVEAKAQISQDEYKRIEDYVISFGNVKTVNRKDEYYYLKDGSFIRLRYEDGKIYLTQKDRSMSFGVEKNIEMEKIVSQNEKDLMLVDSKFAWEKIKKGISAHTSFGKFSNVHLELLEVDSLGCFLEIEIILDLDKEKYIEDAQAEILKCFENLNLTDKIVSKTYSQLMSEKENGKDIQ